MGNNNFKIGDLVWYPADGKWGAGVVVGFNDKGEGGKDMVQVLTSAGVVSVFLSFQCELIRKNE